MSSKVLSVLISGPGYNFLKKVFANCMFAGSLIKGSITSSTRFFLGLVSPSIEGPTTLNASNGADQLNMLEFTRDNAVERFIYETSSSTYDIPPLCQTSGRQSVGSCSHMSWTNKKSRYTCPLLTLHYPHYLKTMNSKSSNSIFYKG